jgi:hypothetical protein
VRVILAVRAEGNSKEKNKKKRKIHRIFREEGATTSGGDNMRQLKLYVRREKTSNIISRREKVGSIL